MLAVGRVCASVYGRRGDICMHAGRDVSMTGAVSSVRRGNYSRHHGQPGCRPESCSKAVLSFSNLIDINFKPFACIPTGLFASSLSELNAQQIIIYLSYFCVFLCKINSFVLNFC